MWLCHSPSLLSIRALLSHKLDATQLTARPTCTSMLSSGTVGNGAALCVTPSRAGASTSLSLAAVVPLATLPSFALVDAHAAEVLCVDDAAATATLVLAGAGAAALVGCAPSAASRDVKRPATWALLLPLTSAAALVLPVTAVCDADTAAALLTDDEAATVHVTAERAVAQMHSRFSADPVACVLTRRSAVAAAALPPLASALAAAALDAPRPLSSRGVTLQWQDADSAPAAPPTTHAVFTAALRSSAAATRRSTAPAVAAALEAAHRFRARASSFCAARTDSDEGQEHDASIDARVVLPVVGCSGPAADVGGNAAAALRAYLQTPESDALPLGDFVADLVATALRTRSNAGASAVADFRRTLRDTLVHPPATLAARHPRGSDATVKRREYTLQVLLVLWLSLEDVDVPHADGSDVQAREPPAASHWRSTAQRASELLAPCALLLQPLGAEGLARFCALHVAPRFGAVAPLTTRRLLSLLGIDVHQKRAHSVTDAAAEPAAAVANDADARFQSGVQHKAKLRRSVAPDVLTAAAKSHLPARGRGSGAHATGSSLRGRAPLKLRRVTLVPPLRARVAGRLPAQTVGLRSAGAGAILPACSAGRISERALLPDVLHLGARMDVCTLPGGRDDSSDGDDMVVPCTALRPTAPALLPHGSPRRARGTPQRQRAVRLFSDDVAGDAGTARSPPPRLSTRASLALKRKREEDGSQAEGDQAMGAGEEVREAGSEGGPRARAGSAFFAQFAEERCITPRRR